MDETFKNLMASGKALIQNTKTAKTKSIEAPKKGFDTKPVDSNPHKTLIRRCKDEKISKRNVVEELKKMIDAAEADL